jgi:hypothetical protein
MIQLNHQSITLAPSRDSPHQHCGTNLRSSRNSLLQQILLIYRHQCFLPGLCVGTAKVDITVAGVAPFCVLDLFGLRTSLFDFCSPFGTMLSWGMGSSAGAVRAAQLAFARDAPQHSVFV